MNCIYLRKSFIVNAEALCHIYTRSGGEGGEKPQCSTHTKQLLPITINTNTNHQNLLVFALDISLVINPDLSIHHFIFTSSLSITLQKCLFGIFAPSKVQLLITNYFWNLILLFKFKFFSTVRYIFILYVYIFS